MTNQTTTTVTNITQGLTQTETDALYVPLLGGTMTGPLSVNLASGTVGLKVLQTISGSIIKSDNLLATSGSLIVDGAAIFKSTLRIGGVTYTFPYSDGSSSGKVLKTNSAGQLSWSTDLNTGGVTVGQGIRLINGAVALNATISGTTLKFRTVSGAIVKSDGLLAASGSLIVDGATILKSTLKIGGVTYAFPTSDGSSSGKVLKTDAAGHLSWSTDLNTGGGGTGNFGTGNVVTILSGTALTSSTGSLKTFFDANYLRTSTGSLRALFNTLYFQSSTGALANSFKNIFLASSTGALKTNFGLQFIQSSTGALKSAFHTQFVHSSTGSLKTYFDSLYQPTGSYLTSIKAGQGLTLIGTNGLRLSSTISGTTLKFQTVSGSIVKSDGLLAASGSLIVDGAAILKSTLKIGGVTYTFPTSDGSASGKVLKTDAAGHLSWSTDNNSGGGGTGNFGTGNVVTIISGTALTSSTGSLSNAFKSIFLASSTGALKSNFGSQFIQSSTGALKTAFGLQFIQSSTGALKSAFHTQFVHSSTGSLKTYFDSLYQTIGGYLATSTGALKANFGSQFIQSSTGALKANFGLQFIQSSTGALKAAFASQFIQSSTGALKAAFASQFVQSSTGALKTYNDTLYQAKGSNYLTAIGQGLTVINTTGVKLSATISGTTLKFQTISGASLNIQNGAASYIYGGLEIGATKTHSTALEVLGTISGSNIFATKNISASGTLVVDGAAVLKSTLKIGGVTYTFPYSDGSSSGKVLKTNGAGVLSWSTDGGTGTFGTGNVVTIIGGTALTSSTGSLKSNFGSQFIQSSTGALKSAFHTQFVHSSTGSLKTYFDSLYQTIGGYLATSTGSLKTLFDANYLRTSTGSLKTFFDANYFRTSTGALKANFGLQFIQSSTGALKAAFASQFVQSSTGSLKTYFDTFYQPTGSYLTSIKAGQGLTLIGTNGLRLSSTITGTTLKFQTISGAALNIQNGNSYLLGNVSVGTTSAAKTKLEVVGTISGSTIFSTRNLIASGSLIIDSTGLIKGNLTTRGALSGASVAVSNLRNCDTIDTDAAGNFVCGSDSTAGTGLDQAGADIRYVQKSGGTMTGGLLIVSDGHTNLGSADAGILLEIGGVMSGRVLHAQDNLTSSGTLIVQGAATLRSTLKIGGVTYTFPTSDGSASGKVLKTDSAGHLSWSTDLNTGTTPTFGTGNVVTIISGTALTSSTGSLSNAFKSIFLASSTGALKSNFGSQFIQSSTGALKSAFGLQFIQSSTGALKTAFHTQFVHSSTGSLKTYFDSLYQTIGGYLATSTGALKANFGSQFIQSSTGALKANFGLQFIQSSTGALKANFGSQFIQSSTGALKAAFASQFVQSSTGSLKTYNDTLYQAKGSNYITAIGQGLTAINTTGVKLSATISGTTLKFQTISGASLNIQNGAASYIYGGLEIGATKTHSTALEVLGTISGSNIFATKNISASGTLVVDGAAILKSTLKIGGITYTFPYSDGSASGKVLKTNGAGVLSWSTDGGTGTFGTGNVVTIIGGTALTSSTGALKSNFSSQFIQSSTGALKTAFGLQFIQSSTGALKSAFHTQFVHSSTGSLKTYFDSLYQTIGGYLATSTGSLKTLFDANYLRTSTGSLKTFFDANYFRTSTGALKANFGSQFIQSSTGALKANFGLQFIQSSTGALKAAFASQFVQSSTGSLKTYFDTFYQPTGSYLTSIKAGQGLTLIGTNGLRLSSTISGTTLRFQTVSGSTLKADKYLGTSGSLIVDGNAILKSTLKIGGVTYTFPYSDGSASGKVLKTDGAGNLSWSSDLNTGTTPTFGTGNVVTIIGGTALTSSTGSLSNAFKSIFLASSTGALKSNFSSQFIQSSTGALKSAFGLQFIQSSTGALKSAFHTQFVHSSTGSLKTYFDSLYQTIGGYLATSTGALKANFGSQFIQSSTGALKANFGLQFLQSSTGALKSNFSSQFIQSSTGALKSAFASQFIQSSTGALKAAFASQFVQSSTGALKTYNDTLYQAKGSNYLTAIGQGLTAINTTGVRLSATISGTTLKFQTISGASLNIQNGAASYIYGGLEIGATKTHSTALEVLGTISGSNIFATKNISASGTLVVDGAAVLKSTLKLNGVTYTFPYSDGSASGKVLKTDSAGKLSWSTDSTFTNFGTGNVVTIIGGTALTSSTGALKANFGSQFIQSSTGALKANFGLQFLQSSTGALQASFANTFKSIFLASSTGALKSNFSNQFIQSSTGALKAAFASQFVQSSTGSLKTYFDTFYQPTGSYLTSIKAGQGLTLIGTNGLRLSSTISGTTLKFQTVSGAIVKSDGLLAASGSLIVDGAAILKSTLKIGGVTYTFPTSDGSASGKVLKTDSAGKLSWSSDLNAGAFSGTGALQTFFNGLYLQTSTGALKANFGSQFIQSSTGALRAAFASQFIQSSTGALKANFGLQFLQSSTGALQASFANTFKSIFLASSTGALKANFASQFIQSSTGALKANFSNQFIQSSTGALKTAFGLQFIQSSTGALRSAFATQFVQSSTGALKTYNDTLYQAKGSNYLTAIGQGLTAINTTGVRLSATISGTTLKFQTISGASLNIQNGAASYIYGGLEIGATKTHSTALEVLGTISGSNVFATKNISASGALIVDSTGLIKGNLTTRGTFSGAAITVSNLRSCDTIDTDAAGNFVCGSDATGGGGGNFGTGNVITIISGTALTSSTGSLSNAFKSIFLASSTGALKANFGSQFIQSSTGALKSNFSNQFIQSSTGALKSAFGLQFIQSSTGALKAAFSSQFVQSSTGALKTYNDTLYQAKGSNYLIAVGQGLTAINTTGVRLSATISGTTLKFQTISGASLNIQNGAASYIYGGLEIGATKTHSTALEVLGTISGSNIFATKNISASGALIVDGAAVFKSTIKLNGVTYTFPYSDGSASGKVLKTDSAGKLSWSTDSTAGVVVGQGIQLLNSAVALNSTITGTTLKFQTISGASLNIQNGASSYIYGGLEIGATKTHSTPLEVLGTISGSNTFATKNITASGKLVIDSAAVFKSTVKLNGVTYTFPAYDGTASGKVLKTDSAGQLSWSADSTSTSAVGQGVRLLNSAIALNTTISGTTLKFQTISGASLNIQNGAASYIYGGLEIGATKTHSTALEVLGTISGSNIFATKNISASGTLVVDGAAVLKSTLKLNGVTYTFPYSDGSSSGKVLKTSGAGVLVWSTDSTGGGSVVAGQGIQLLNSAVALNSSISGTTLKFQTISGSTIRSQNNIVSSGGLIIKKYSGTSTGVIMALDTQGLIYNATTKNVGLGTTLPSQALTISRPGADAAIYFAIPGASTTVAGSASSAGPNSPGTTGTEANGTSTNWTSASNITSSDNNYANITPLGTGADSYYLKGSNYSFAIPAGATINGIAVEWERKASGGSSNLVDNKIRIIKADATIGTTDKSSGTTWSTTEAYFTYGSSSDLWGETWTSTDINDADFGAALAVHANSMDSAVVDHTRITVYYTTASTTSSSGRRDWSIGANNSNLGRFTLAQSGSVGTRPFLVVTESGAFGFGRNVTAPGTTFAFSGSMIIGKNIASSAIDTAGLEVLGTMSGVNLTVSALKSCAGLQTNGVGVAACTSDATLKDIHNAFTGGLAAVRQINPQTYSWKANSGLYDGGVLYSGFIAQNVQQGLSEAVNIGASGKLQVSQVTILAAVVNAVKELDRNFSSGTTIHVRDLLSSSGALMISGQARFGSGVTIASRTTNANQNLLQISSNVTSPADPVFRVTAGGDVSADGAFTGGGADYAEWFTTSDANLQFGEAVCIDVTRANTVRRCSSSGDPDIIGLVSSKEQAAFIGNKFSGAEGLAVPNTVLVGLLGQLSGDLVVDASAGLNASIRPGDPLAAGIIPGTLRKALPGESTVGVALEGLDSGRATKKVLISRKNQSITTEVVSDRVLQTIKDLRIEDGLKIAMQKSFQSLSASGAFVQPVQDEVQKQIAALSIGTITDRLSALESRLNVLAIQTAGSQSSSLPAFTQTLSGSVQSGDITARSLSLDQSLTAQDGRFVGDLHVDHNLDVGGVFSVRDLYVPNAIRIDGELHAASLYIQSNAIVNGTLTLNSDLNLTKSMVFASGSLLSAHDLLVKSALRVVGSVTINGLAEFLGDIEVHGQLIVSDRQAGFITIPASGSSATVLFGTGFLATPIVTVTPNGRVGGEWWVDPVTLTGFTLNLGKIADHPVRFSWVSVGVRHARTSTGSILSDASHIPFPIDANGVPVSSSDAWNSCIRNHPLLQSDGSPIHCGGYHDGYIWQHPDLQISFTYNTLVTPAYLSLPEGYFAVVQATVSSSSSSEVPSSVSSSSSSSSEVSSASSTASGAVLSSSAASVSSSSISTADSGATLFTPVTSSSASTSSVFTSSSASSVSSAASMSSVMSSVSSESSSASVETSSESGTSSSSH